MSFMLCFGLFSHRSKSRASGLERLADTEGGRHRDRNTRDEIYLHNRLNRV